MRTQRLLVAALLVAVLVVPFSGAAAGAPSPDVGPSEPVRVAAYNASLNRFSAGELLDDLSSPDDAQAQRIAEVTQQRTRSRTRTSSSTT